MKLEDAKLWTVEQCCGKGCDPVDDACDAAGHPYYDRIILHPKEWKKVRAENRIAEFVREQMTEQEYIDVRNLSSVLSARRELSDIVADNQPAIDADEFKLVSRLLLKFEEALFERVIRWRDLAERVNAQVEEQDAKTE